MAIYRNRGLQDQQIKVAMQERQREIDRRARDQALAQTIGVIGQSAGNLYTINAKEVAAKARELGLNSPEEVEGLKKVMEVAEQTGLTVEEIANSEQMMLKLNQEAAAAAKNRARLDESIGELGEMRRVKGEELKSLQEQYDAAEQVTADARKRAKDIASLEGTLGGPLPLGIDSSYEADTKYLNEKADRNSISSEMHRMKIEDLDIQDKIKAREAERKAIALSPENAAKLKALESMGVSGEELAALRRSAQMAEKLDSLAYNNLMGKDYVRRQATAGARQGRKDLAAAALLKMKEETAKTRAETAKTKAKTAADKAASDQKNKFLQQQYDNFGPASIEDMEKNVEKDLKRFYNAAIQGGYAEGEEAAQAALSFYENAAGATKFKYTNKKEQQRHQQEMERLKAETLKQLQIRVKNQEKPPKGVWGGSKSSSGGSSGSSTGKRQAEQKQARSIAGSMVKVVEGDANPLKNDGEVYDRIKSVVGNPSRNRAKYTELKRRYNEMSSKDRKAFQALLNRVAKEQGTTVIDLTVFDVNDAAGTVGDVKNETAAGTASRLVKGSK